MPTSEKGNPGDLGSPSGIRNIVNLKLDEDDEGG